VISIDVKLNPDRPEHPRITYIEGQAQKEETFNQVLAITGDAPNALVVLGSLPGSNLRMELEFSLYSKIVPKGSYVIMEHTMYNGHPVWPGHGPGPWEAVRRALSMYSDFAVDTTMEKYGLTFNPEGYLKRIKD
jgi:cephalosporin hydroxylase